MTAKSLARSDATLPSRIGLLAGSEQYPIYFAQGARQCGFQVVALAIEQECDPRLADHVDEIHWAGVGLLQKILNTFRESGVTDVVMTGKIHKNHLFTPVQLDDLMKRVIQSLAQRDDVTLLQAITNEFENAGLAVREPTLFLKNLQAEPGVLTRREPTKGEMNDVKYAFGVAKDLAKHGIGQTVVVRNGVILAVEAIEGTDKTILRAGALIPDPLVVVKVGSPQHDRRFDMPVIGMETLRTLAEAHASVLAIDAEFTVIVDKNCVIEQADRQGLSIVAV
jgi:UDP-2,3-diacylglucosamine hydrolase